jgi:hypothetical protein
MREGVLLPAQEYSEDYTPDWSSWWPPSIMRLHRDASTEEAQVKYCFRLLFPFNPLHADRAAQTPKFRHENMLLNARLGLLAHLPPPSKIATKPNCHTACVRATFFIRTWVEAGMTAAAASHAGYFAFAREKELEAAAVAAAQYSAYFFGAGE